MHRADDRVVLHVDVDAFFCQVEQRAHPELQGRAIAVQQHQDIIALNYKARAAGVKKHMSPREARELLSKVSGQVAHVHLEPGGRVSYGPYRAVSKDLIKLFRRFREAAVVEKASIDEAYLLLRSPGGAALDIQTGMNVGAAIKEAVRAELCLTVSVGVARNKLLAKLTSQSCKPDGLAATASPEAVQQLLAAMPARRLPGCGGKVIEALELAGVKTAADLQGWTLLQMQTSFGFPEEFVHKLLGWARGVDESEVVERPPPKTLSVQMSLTPILLPKHPGQADAPLSGGANPEELQPLVVGARDYGVRCGQVLRAMTGDLLGRVREDRQEEDRWPRRLQLQVRFMGGGADKNRFHSGSCAFPSPLLSRRRQHAASSRQTDGDGPEEEPLLAAMLANMDGLVKVASTGVPPAAALVEVRVLATNFGPYAAAAAPSIKSFFAGRAPAQPASTTPPAQAGQADAAASNSSSARPAGGRSHTASPWLPAIVKVELQAKATAAPGQGSLVLAPTSAMLCSDPCGPQRDRQGAVAHGGASCTKEDDRGGHCDEAQLGAVAQGLPPARDAAGMMSTSALAAGVLLRRVTAHTAAAGLEPVRAVAPPLPLQSDADTAMSKSGAQTASQPQEDVDLGAVNVREQQRIWQNIQQGRSHSADGVPWKGSRTESGSSSRGSKRKAAGGAAKGRKQNVAAGNQLKLTSLYSMK